MTTISNNLQGVRERIVTACTRALRPSHSVDLLAVSKTWGPEAVREAFAAGQTRFGENYIQEAVGKITALQDLPLEWHCIGPIQSNKTALVAAHFAWVHSIDRLKIAQRLSDQRPTDLPPLQVCLQVNVDGGVTKSGVPPAQVLALAAQVAALPRLCLRGLMVIPEPAADYAAQVAVFAQAKALFDSVAAAVGPMAPHFDTLSMGMTADLEAAVAAGSTLVRVGTAIFGVR
ncbi:YggS family pyridoxal phosphate-dependent enzyme [Rhodoferax sp. WC2427]|uniref:YggS family pyridoxal phosphate-dependent enzyme n=1 Tax=Rhodoferax sp. WC2427 TaxID=3234144 RepID=UPI0034665DF8